MKEYHIRKIKKGGLKGDFGAFNLQGHYVWGTAAPTIERCLFFLKRVAGVGMIVTDTSGQVS